MGGAMSGLSARITARKSGERSNWLPSPRQSAAIFAVLAAMVLVVLDAAIANVALPSIGGALKVTPALSVLVVTAYQLALVMALLPCAALGESKGYRRLFTQGVALFTAASALCALSPSLPWLVAARFLQGIGGAAVMSLGVALLRQIVPHSRLGAAIGWNALAVALSSAAGPPLGAFILSVLPWPWLFIINLPLGVIILIASRSLPFVAGTRRRLDLFSIALNASGFGGFVTGAELLPVRPAPAAALLIAAASSLALLFKRELPRKAPLIPLDLLRSGSFRVSVIASICCFTGQTAGTVALPFLLQHGLHQTTLLTGIFIMPWPLTVAVTAPVASRLANRLPGAWLCAVGGLLLAAGLAAISTSPAHASPLRLVPFIMLCGLGFGLFQVPNNREMFLAAPSERSAAAGGMQGTARLTGQTMGAVMMTLLFTLTTVNEAPRMGLAIGASLALIAGLVSTLRRPQKPAYP
jgi:MFS transporter, DHA2 family, multidrug resistance protein